MSSSSSSSSSVIPGRKRRRRSARRAPRRGRSYPSLGRESQISRTGCKCCQSPGASGAGSTISTDMLMRPSASWRCIGPSQEEKEAMDAFWRVPPMLASTVPPAGTFRTGVRYSRIVKIAWSVCRCRKRKLTVAKRSEWTVDERNPRASDPGLAALVPVEEDTRIPWEGGRVLHRWWHGARRGRRMPSRSDFSPRIMGRHLGGMVLHDVSHGEEPDFRVRLAGSDLVDIMNFDPTGLPMCEVPNGAPIIARYRWVVRERRPYMCLDLPLDWANKDYRSYSTLVMPLSDDGERVDMLIAHVHFVPIAPC
ncbi:MAG: PAS domain-containing protein [Alphaproteobacteria bacterium]|nr:MAG: PAS domain-containing protein [Alphaproteobacteria bacterium]